MKTKLVDVNIDVLILAKTLNINELRFVHRTSNFVHLLYLPNISMC
jgi:hypothetical protein